MRLNKIVIIILLSVNQILAQDITTTEVNVVEGFKPTIPHASRLNTKAIFSDTIKKDRSQLYEAVAIDLKTDYKVRFLNPAKVRPEKISELYGTKLGIGFGNSWMTKASILNNSKRSKTLSYGILMNHFGNKYAASNALCRNNKNTLDFYGKKMSKSNIYMVNFNYDRRTALFLSENPPLFAEENYRNRFAYTKVSFSAISKELAADKLKHYITFFVSDLNEFSENQINLSANLSKTINTVPFSLEIELNDYFNYNNIDSKFESINVQSFHFSPYTYLTKYGFDFDLGLDFYYLSDDTPFDIFPKIKVSKELVQDILLVYGGFRYTAQRNTIKSLSDENPYIHSYGNNQTILSGNAILQNLKTTNTKELYVAMRNVLSNNEVFESSIAYGMVHNLAHFVGYYNFYYNRFLVDYIDVKQLHVNVNYVRKINEIIDLNANANYYNWDVEVYHKPNFNFDISTPINLRNKIKVAPSLSYIGKRESITSVNLKIYNELPSQIHLNFGVYYNYTRNISAYLNLNNLTNSKQDIWIGYKEVGFNGLFGLNYSF